jgi:hypothetical protein
MNNNKLSEIEIAIRNKKKKNIKNILKTNPEEIKCIKTHTILELIHFNELDILDTIFKYIDINIKKNLLSNNSIIIKLLDTNNIEFINKYIKYISLDIDEKYIINYCIDNINYEIIEIIYKIYKQSNFSLLGLILFEYFDRNIDVNIELVKFLIKINKNIVNETYYNKPIIGYAVINNNLELLKILKEAGINFYYDNFNILIYYINSIYNYYYKINNDIILYLLNNNININICDRQIWLAAHYVFFKPEDFTLEVKKIILEKTNNLNIQNTLGNTVLHYLINNDKIDNYKDILIKKELDIFVRNKALGTPLSISIEKNINLMDIAIQSFLYQIKDTDKKFTKEEVTNYILTNKTSIYKKNKNDKNNDDIIIADYNYIDHNKYNGNYINTQLYFVVLLKKYSNLGIPYLPNNNIVIKDKKYENETFNNFIQYSKKYLYHSKEFMYLKIYWADENNYLMTPNIGEAIEYIFKFKRYVFVFIHLYNEYISHANVLIFDRDKKIIIHFEPHGKIYSYVGKLYETLEKIFEKELKNFKYIRPLKYLEINSYQSMYNESDNYNRKAGDVKGYCGAWCFWFIELYINNNKYELKTLVNKSIKKLINTKYTFFEHIRNYANYLNKKTTELLQIYGAPNYIINSELHTEYNNNNILNNIAFDIKQLNY